MEWYEVLGAVVVLLSMIAAFIRSRKWKAILIYAGDLTAVARDAIADKVITREEIKKFLDTLVDKWPF